MNRPGKLDITLAVCTFRRASIDTTLRSLAALVLPGDAQVRVIVADNDDRDDKRPAIQALAASLGLDLRYIHAPARNISVARNACLDGCVTPWLAFIDDDEIATPDWLAELVVPIDSCDIVFGRCQAVYPKGAPRWAVDGDFHSNCLAGNDPPWNGYTSNVLINMECIRGAGLRFAPELGISGGEDTLFFYLASGSGARFGYRPDAVVTEAVDPRRLRLGWLIKRRFRAGQVHHRILVLRGQAWRGSAAAAAKVLACLALALAGLGQPGRWRQGLLRACLHLGVVAAALGFPLYREYSAGHGS